MARKIIGKEIRPKLEIERERERESVKTSQIANYGKAESKRTDSSFVDASIRLHFIVCMCATRCPSKRE